MNICSNILSISVFLSIQCTAQFELSNVKLPQKMANHFVGIFNDSFTVFCGYDGTNSYITTSESTKISVMLNINEWTPNTITMPLNTLALYTQSDSSITIKETLYIITPETVSGTANSNQQLFIYNLKNHQFTVLPSPGYYAQGACSVYNKNNSIIYVIAGSNSIDYQKYTQRFHVSNNTWLTPAANTVNTLGYGGCSMDATNEHIFYFGGRGVQDPSIVVNEIEKYTVVSDKWILLATTLSTARYHFQCKLLSTDGYIYCIGGLNGIGLNTVDVFSPTTETIVHTWHLNEARAYSADTLWNDDSCIIVSGGYNGTDYLDSIETFGDCTSSMNNNISSVVKLPQKMREHFAGIYNDTFTLLGGVDSTNSFIQKHQTNTIYITLNDNEWSSNIISLPLNISGLSHEDDSSVTINEKLYIINPSVSGGTAKYNHEMFIYDFRTNELSVSVAPTYQVFGVCVVYNSNNHIIYVLGGYNAGDFKRYTQRFNILTNIWISPGANTVNAKYHAGCALDASNEHIFYFGGYSASNGVLDEIEKYSMLNNEWNMLSTTLTERKRFVKCRLLSLDMNIYCIGGYGTVGELNTIDIFDPTTQSIINTTYLNIARYYFTATLWNDDQCIIIGGGWDGTSYFDAIETIGDCTAPTKSPSTAPTNSPSAAPSIFPSTSPSVSPTKSPTLPPTLAPSTLPSSIPSISPSNSPSKSPTMSPTLTPTKPPSAIPSIYPTTSPTIPPTLSPISSCFDYNNEFSND
eukprot:261350_1